MGFQRLAAARYVMTQLQGQTITLY
jgi:hypothetical protein